MSMQTSVMLMEATLLLEQQAKRIEALEAALRDVEHYLHYNNNVKAWRATRAALAPEQDKSLRNSVEVHSCRD